MNSDDIKKDLQTLKTKSPEAYNNIAEISLPFYMFYDKYFQGGNNLLKNKYNLSRIEMDVLTSLYFSGDNDTTLSPTQLYDRLLFSSGGMTKVLKKLENKNYIKRIENKLDKRSKLVQITNEAKAIMLNALKDVLAYEESCFVKLNDEEKKLFKSLLQKLL